MKSEKGEIEVFLCPEEDETSSSSSSSSPSAYTSPSRPANGFPSPNGNRFTKLRKIRSKNDPTTLQYIDDDDDDKDFQLQTVDQNLQPICDSGIDISSMATFGSEPFLSLEPPLTDTDYTFTMDDEEGISNLFDGLF